MTFQRFLTGTLLTFVVVSLGAAVAEVAGLYPSHAADTASSAAPSGEQWVAFYFHSSHRCPTCRAIEANTRAAVIAGSPEPVELRVLNYEEPAQQHFAKQFDLAFPSVILALVRDGSAVRWKILDRVWDLWEDRPAFVTYVRTELTNFKEGRP
jgi:hypothetical protein